MKIDVWFAVEDEDTGGTEYYMGDITEFDDVSMSTRRCPCLSSENKTFLERNTQCKAKIDRVKDVRFSCD